MEYLYCCFSARENGRGEVTIEGMTIPKIEKFKYLGSIIQQNGDIGKDINQRIKASWIKWKYASCVLCDKRMPIGLNGKVDRMVVRPAMMYDAECGPIKKTQVQKLMVAEIRTITWIYGYTRIDKISNGVIRDLVKVAPIEDKMR